ncbi:D-alanine--D-alanine ligase [Candidatus Magnetoovum chiemensis]|nr:D-alanine--D-alanine ligase [Candidatus Magnetoovum chiemensis]
MKPVIKIGLTYDLRSDYLKRGFSEEDTAEFDAEETICALAEAITALDFEVDRIGNLSDLIEHLYKGRRWALVFNICEGMYGRSREGQVTALLDAYKIPYIFSDTVTLSLCLDKSLTKLVVRAFNVPTAEFYLIKSQEDLKNENLLLSIAYPLFVKPVHEGTGKGIDSMSIVYDKASLIDRCSGLLRKYNQPVLVEKYLSGREFTVGIVERQNRTDVLGVLEVKIKNKAEAPVYSYHNKENFKEKVEYSIVTDEAIVAEASDISLTVFKELDCRDAARVDLRADESGRLCFLEINPLPGLHPTHSDLPILCAMLNIDYTTLISNIITSALKRV